MTRGSSNEELVHVFACSKIQEGKIRNDSARDRVEEDVPPKIGHVILRAVGKWTSNPIDPSGRYLMTLAPVQDRGMCQLEFMRTEQERVQ